ncbi:MAG: type VI secretion system lipoprotein TssJ [Rubrivivax sp.]|nr:type VI secretion system lipoprotein TssJ [Rubrivivax sp.]
MTRDGVVLIRDTGLAPQRRHLLGIGVAGAVVLLGAGCSSAPKVASVAGSIQAAADLNPSVSQRPSPLLLRVYELKTAAGFNQADFMALYQSDAATLGADMVSREEFTLQPGETRPYNKQLGPETRFLAVFAGFRNLEKARWRVAVPVEAGRAQKVLIRAEALSVAALVSP